MGFIFVDTAKRARDQAKYERESLRAQRESAAGKRPVDKPWPQPPMPSDEERRFEAGITTPKREQPTGSSGMCCPAPYSPSKPAGEIPWPEARSSARAGNAPPFNLKGGR